MNDQRSHSLETVPRIDLQGAKAEFDRATALFVDVRKHEDYEKCHIPGSISIPLAEIRARADELLSAESVITF